MSDDHTGTLICQVMDDNGEGLQGAAVTLSGGVGEDQVQATDADGECRFLRLVPGTYKVEALLGGFASAVQEEVIIRIGETTVIQMRMVDLFC